MSVQQLTPEEVEDFLRETYEMDWNFEMEETTEMETERDLCDIVKEEDEARLENLDELHLAVGVYEATENFRGIEQHACVCCTEDQLLIAVTGPAGDRESEWHADLFAAAPELLAACEVALAVWGPPAGKVDRDYAEKLLNAAIAKALGKPLPSTDPFAE